MSDQVENPGGGESIEDAIDALLEEVDADCIEFEEKKARADALADAEANGTAALGDDGKPIVSDEPATDAAAQAEEAIERADEKLDELEAAADELVASVTEQTTDAVEGADEAEAGADPAAQEPTVEEPAVEEPVSEDAAAAEAVAEEAEPEVDESQLDAAVDRMLGELGVEEAEGNAAAANEDDAAGPEADSSAAVEAASEDEAAPEGVAPEVAPAEAVAPDDEVSTAGAVETEAAEPEGTEADASGGQEAEPDAAPEPEDSGEAAGGENDGDDVLAAAVSFLADEDSDESGTAEEPEAVEEDALHHAAGELLDGAGAETDDADPGEVESGEAEASAESENEAATESAPAAEAEPEPAPKPEAPTAVTDPSAPPSFDALLDGAFEDSDGEIDDAVDTAAVAAEAAQHSPVVGPDEGGQKAEPSKKARAATPRAAVVTEALPAGAGRFARFVAWARPRAIELGRRGLKASGPLGAKAVVLLSKPLDGKPPKIRDSIGWVALWTMFLAICVWGYLVVRAPVKPVPDGNGSKVVATETATQD